MSPDAEIKLENIKQVFDWLLYIFPDSWSYIEVGNVLCTARHEVLAWQSGEKTPTGENREKLELLFELCEISNMLFRDDNRARNWFNGEIPTLNRKRPVELLVAGEMKQVVTALGRLLHGVYS